MIQRLAHYQLGARLGRGAMGVVHRAWDEERGRDVALKTLNALEPEALVWLKREFRNVADTVHPNLAMLYELVAEDEQWFITMELVDGVDLLTHLREPGRSTWPSSTPWSRLRATLVQITEGLVALHDDGLLHLDIKPSNVLVREDGRVVILDFGLSQIRSTETQVGERVLSGTPDYMAPERLLHHPATQDCDWYALGVMVFQALTGQLPFEASTWDEFMQRCREDAPRARSLTPAIPPELDELCAGLLRRDPVRRWGRDELRACLSAGSVAQASEPAVVPPRSLLIGRDDEFDELGEAYEEVKNGRGKACLIGGPSGIGKSTLLHAFLDRVDGDAFVLRGRCYERESVPFKGFDPIVDQLAQHLRTLRRSVQARLLGGAATEAGRLFPILRSMPGWSPGRVADGADPIEQRRVAFEGFKALLTNLAAERPVVVAIDDLHWGGLDSIRLLLACLTAPDPPPVLVIASYRSDEFREGGALFELLEQLDDPRTQADVQRIELGDLAEDEARELATTILGDDDPPLVERMLAEAGGNPILLEELVRYQKTGAESLSISLADALGHRLDRLPDELRPLMWALALAGEPTEQGIALAAAGVEAHDALARLRRSKLIRSSGPRVSDTIEVYHDQIRSCALARIPRSSRATLHLELARGLEHSGRARPDQLARHFHGGGQLPRASRYAEQAGDLAAKSLAFDRAASHFGDALAWMEPDGVERTSLLTRRARALVNAGRCGDAGPVFLDAASTGGAAEPRRLESEAVDAFLSAGMVDEGLAVLRPMLETLHIRYPKTQGHAVLGIIRRLLGLWRRGIEFTPRDEASLVVDEFLAVDLRHSAGKALNNILPLHGLHFSIDALKAALAAGEPSRVGRSLAIVGGNLTMAGGLIARGGEACLSKAAEIADEHDDDYVRGMISLMRGVGHCTVTGRWPDALELVDDGMARLKASCAGLRWETTLAFAVSMLAAEMIGDWNDFRSRLTPASTEAVELGDLYFQTMTGQMGGAVLITTGDIEGARALDASALARWFQHEFTVQHASSLQTNIQCDLYDRDFDRAWRRYEEGFAAMKKVNMHRFAVARIRMLWLEALIRLSLYVHADTDGAPHSRRCRAISKRLRREARVDGPLHGAFLDAALMALAGDVEASSEALRSCARRYEEAHMRLHGVLCRRRRAELLEDHASMAAMDARMRQLGIADPESYLFAAAPHVRAP